MGEIELGNLTGLMPPFTVRSFGDRLCRQQWGSVVTVTNAGKKQDRGCFFCGSKPRTWEHVLPDWLGELLSLDPGGIFKHERASDGSYSFHDKDLGQSIMRLKVKEPCGACNNGWMSLLETQMKMRLVQLMLGEPSVLAGVTLKAVWRWAIKTHMMRTQWDTAGFPYSQSHKDAVRRGGEFPEGWRIWIGEVALDGVWHRNWSAEFRPKSGGAVLGISQTTLILGGMFLAVSYSSDTVAGQTIGDAISATADDYHAPLVMFSGAEPMLAVASARTLTGDACTAISDVSRRWAGEHLGSLSPRLPDTGFHKHLAGVERSGM